MTIALHADNVERSFGTGELKAVAVAGVSIELEAGRMTVLMGPSGSGKSTLLAILSGLLRPDRGRVVCLGQDLWELSEPKREAFRLEHCGFIFQGYNLFPALTASQQVEIVLEWGAGVPKREARKLAGQTLESLGLGAKTHLRPQELSGGEKQRVAVARALVKSPQLLFADEPTAALDWEHGRQVVDLLRRAARERHATVLLVSHDPRILPFADRVVHLVDGKVHADDGTDALVVGGLGAIAGVPVISEEPK